MAEIVEEMRCQDPVRAEWHVCKLTKGIVWCDTSSIVMGVERVEIDGMIVEDVAYLRKTIDYNHINVTELNTTIKSVNKSLKWRLKNMKIRNYSTTFLNYSGSVIAEKRKSGNDYPATVGNIERIWTEFACRFCPDDHRMGETDQGRDALQRKMYLTKVDYGLVQIAICKEIRAKNTIIIREGLNEILSRTRTSGRSLVGH